MNTTPGERLKQFFESTHLSVRDFAKEIGSENKYRTLYAVFNGEREPSPKLVRSIIRRFPQLSFDWIFVGAGTMILEQSANMISQNDYNLGVSSRVDDAMDRLDKVEFALNELANQITRSMAHQAEMTNIFFAKIDMLVQQEKNLTETAGIAMDKIQKMNDLVEETSSFVVETSEAMKKNNKQAKATHEKLNQLNADKIHQATEEFMIRAEEMKGNKDIAEQCLAMMTTLVDKVKQNNELQNKWEGHLVPLTKAAEMINQMGGGFPSQKP